MALLTRLLVLIPLVLSIVGMVLSALSLFAGHKQGFMEDYAIARLNVSMMGQELLSTSDDKAEEKDDGDDGFFDSVGDKISDLKDDVIDYGNDLLGDGVDRVTEELGIADWYSIHVMDSCQGYYKPNATDAHPSLNSTNCTDSEPGQRFNLSKILDKKMSLGPVEVSINDLGWTPEVQDKLDILNDALLGLFILYVLGMGFSGLAILGCIAAFFLPEKRTVHLANFVIATLGALSLLVASILVTVAVTKGVDEINDVAEEINIEVDRGNKFLIISWVAAGVLLTSVIFWAGKFCVAWRANRHFRRSEKGMGGYHS
ncbi:actin cortical patch SUR7/pH-response regulator pali [Emericellopsis atlantica]|uniref:Actin cortical patch SUR7/pH-response regulator pali n=1 Tax=Emericellopsis atlantica TaxID=2614577 RepID=A0A9P8CQF1_9HYPO|nr:actin cortical patch SUR7/pH-response regulator pali [Emericellopsis atlantica]KAG9255854.1 actin cortical patch SUR7/pH-response regulator pali [Emericellopsis atlantica]